MDFQAFYLESAKGFQEIVGSVRNSGMYGFGKNSKKRNLTIMAIEYILTIDKTDSVIHNYYVYI